jgi:quinol monooxygenase YgiN
MKVVSHVTAAPHEIGPLVELLLKVGGATRQEPGCVSYEVFENVQDPTDITVISEFTDQRAYEEHFGQPYMLDLLGELPSLTAGEIENRVLKAVDE